MWKYKHASNTKPIIRATCPISVKDEKNRMTSKDFTGMSNKEMFLSGKNVYYIINTIITMNNMNNPLKNMNAIIPTIPSIMVKWASDAEIDDYETLADNILTELGFINKQFLIDNIILYDVTCVPDLIGVGSVGYVTDQSGNIRTKKYTEMTAADYRTLDLRDGSNQDTYLSNGVFRNNNRVPIWQKSMSVRPYDRDNGGFRELDPELSSLGNQTHGYNMDNIIKGSTGYINNTYESF